MPTQKHHPVRRPPSRAHPASFSLENEKHDIIHFRVFYEMERRSKT